jgi:EmrB/QacA subfamily drug resistance transporter
MPQDRYRRSDPDGEPTAEEIAMTTGPTALDATMTARQRNAVLAVMCFALMVVVAAMAGLNVALSEIARSTGASQRELQWIVDSYALVFASLLLPAGAIGDRLGRRPVLLTGLAIFGVASAAAIVFDTPNGLIAARAVMGIGAALIMPVTLSVITTVFPPDERPRAVAIWVGIAGASGAIGLLVAGALLEWYSWSSFFLMNVVLAALAVVGTVVAVPATRSEHPPRLDPLGALLSMAGLVALVYAIIEGPVHGWSSTRIVGSFAAAAVLLALFVLWELRMAQPMLDPRLFKLRGFSLGSFSLVVQFLCTFGTMFILLQYLQLVRGYSAFVAGAAVLPLPLSLVPVAKRTPRIVARFGPSRVGAVGLACIGVAFVLLAGLDDASAYWHVAVGLVLLGAGTGLSGIPATTSIVSSLPAARQGVASAMNDLCRELGGALGIALFGSVLNDRYRGGIDTATDGLPAAAAEAARTSLAAAHSVADRLGEGGVQLARQADGAFVDGLSAAFVVGALLAAGAAALVVVGGWSRQQEPPAGELGDLGDPNTEATTPPAAAPPAPASADAGASDGDGDGDRVRKTRAPATVGRAVGNGTGRSAGDDVHQRHR